MSPYPYRLSQAQGARLKRLRKRRSWCSITRAELAELTGLERSADLHRTQVEHNAERYREASGR